jgi:hypothetical protein
MGMGRVEDVRKVLQDFLVPELRVVAARFDAIGQRFDSFSKVMDARFEAMSNRFDAVDTQFASLEKEIARVRERLDVDRRLAKLESQHSQPTQ